MDYKSNDSLLGFVCRNEVRLGSTQTLDKLMNKAENQLPPD